LKLRGEKTAGAELCACSVRLFLTNSFEMRGKIWLYWNDTCFYKSENFALAFCIVRLLVKAVAGGASKGSGKNKQHYCEHLARTNEPEA